MESKRPVKEQKEHKEKKDDLKSHRLFQLPKTPVVQSGLFPGNKMFLKSKLHYPPSESSGNVAPLDEAIQYMESGEHQEAIRLFLLIIYDCDQDNLDLYLACYNISLCYSHFGNISEARRFIDKAVAILLLEIPQLEELRGIPDMKSMCFLEKGKIHRNLGNQYLINGDVKRYDYEIAVALHYMQKATEVLPDNYIAYNSLGLLQATLGDFDAAKDFYEKALLLNENYASAHTNLGVLLKDEGRYEESVEHFDEAILVEPNNGLHYQNRGLAYQALGRLDEAIVDFEKSVELDPSQYRYKVSVATNWLLRGDGESAISYLERLLIADTNNINILINLSAAYVMAGKYQQAVGVCNKALEGVPTELTCLQNLSTSYYMLGNYENALMMLDKIISDPRFKDSNLRYGTYVQIAQIMTRFKYFDEAVNAYEAAYELCSSESDKARLDFELGNLYFDNRNYDEALFRYQRANAVWKSDVISNYMAETKEMIQNPGETPVSRNHIDIPVVTTLSDGFKNELEESLEFKLCRVRNRSITYSKSLDSYPLLLSDEVKQRNPKLYELSRGKDGFWYKRGIYRMSSGVAQIAKGKNKYNFVVKKDEDDQLKIIIGHVGHFYLSKQEDVLFAGEIIINDGRIGLWNNGSGHFKPKARSAEAVARVTELPMEKFFSLENTAKLLKGLYEKYQNVEKMAKIGEMRDLGLGDKRVVKSMRRYFR